jgi:phosphatidylglycerol:prolipoprotein diacylglycerol transferase
VSGQNYYTLFMILSLVVFLLVRWRLPKPSGYAGLPRWKKVAVFLAGFVGGTLGAKLPFVLIGEEGLFSPTTWVSDGKTITTALIGGYVAIEIAKWLLEIHTKTGDTIALPLACALAVGRFGCFFNGCCHGVATDMPWGVDFGDGVARHPTQIYEVVFHLGMAGLLLFIMKANVLGQHRLQFYLIGYGVYRFLVEFIRLSGPREPQGWWGLSFYQWMALVLIAGLAVQWRGEERFKKRGVEWLPG